MTRRAALLVLIAAFTPQIAAAQFVRQKAIPEAYWGTWARSNATRKNEDTSVIVLSAHTYVSSGISCTVNYVRTTPGPKGPTCSARLQCSNSVEQAEKKTAANLIIRPGDADQIFVGPEFASLTPYKRCSAGAPGAQARPVYPPRIILRSPLAVRF